MFEMPIYGPIVLEVQVKDQQYVNEIEAIMHSQLLYFVAQTDKDHDTFVRECKEKNRWKVSVVAHPKETMADYPPKYSQQQLRQLGFDCLISDLVEAPEAVKVVLCNYTNMNSVVRRLSMNLIILTFTYNL
jgi:chromosome segregation ATPase